MNLIAIDIGNTKIKVAFYLNDDEKLIKSFDGNAGDVESQLADILTECWDQAPLVKSAKEPVKLNRNNFSGIFIYEIFNPRF